MSHRGEINSGFRIVGPNTSNGETHCWYAPTLEEANRMAKFWCEDTGNEYLVLAFVGRWRRAPLPVEFVAADAAAESPVDQAEQQAGKASA